MRRVRTAVLVAAAWAAGCGGAPLPPGIQPPDTTPPTTQPVDTSRSLWPLSTGSSWTYRITEASRPVFEKRVTVRGPEPVPEVGGEAIVVHSEQPHLQETSWQVESGGVVLRLREEDHRDALLLRTTTWEPGTVKSLSAVQAPGWVHEAGTRETVRLSSGQVEEDARGYRWRVVGTESVTVPAGTFPEALKVERTRTDKEAKVRTYWLVPGVGKVREDGERLEELTAWDVKPG